MGLSQFDEILPLANGVIIALADGTTPKSLYASQATPTRFDHLMLSSTAPTPHDVAIYYRISGVNYLACVVSVPAGAGTSAVPPVDMFAPGSQLAEGIPLVVSGGLYIGCLVTLSGAETITCCIIGGFL
jgi:hypothetical protein